MKHIPLTLAAVALASGAAAQDTRSADAHVHGVSTLTLATDAHMLEINLLSPGADIVGFEYAASTDADKEAIAAAIRTLSTPENVITLPEAAECRLSAVLAHLHGHDHDDEMDAHVEGEHDHAEGEHAHAEGEHAHAEGEHDHAEGEHDHAEGEHDHAEGEHDHAEGEHDHAEGEHDHAEGAQHSEFHIRYEFDCAHPDELKTVALPFFAQFENAMEIEAEFVTQAGAGMAEITRDAAELVLH